MVAGHGPYITIDGDLAKAQSAAPKMGPKYTLDVPTSWSAERYEGVIVSLLNTLSRSRAANAVLLRLRKPLMIRPWIWTPTNAAAIPDSAVAAVAERDQSCGFSGSGKGSGVTVWITPRNRIIPDATLLHECVHAMRHMEGARTCSTYPANFDTEEEYLAILITNVFMSEMKRTLIRTDHRGNSWVDAKSPCDQFRVDPFLITTFGMRHSSLYMDLGRVREAKFNPFNPTFSDKLQTVR